MKGKKVVAAFDFDGTITRRDTLLEFIKFTRGKSTLYKGLVIYSPILIFYKLGLYPNWKAKQKLFSFFFKGMDYKDFCKKGEDFAACINDMVRQHYLLQIKTHLEKGDTIYVISASIEEWVKPWCRMNGINNIIGTKVETDNRGKLTGKFLSRNCYGGEKVRRLLEKEPNRNTYYLYAYGDSRGDKELLDFANEKYWVK